MTASHVGEEGHMFMSPPTRGADRRGDMPVAMAGGRSEVERLREENAHMRDALEHIAAYPVAHVLKSAAERALKGLER